jgi:hypothetical protein
MDTPLHRKAVIKKALLRYAKDKRQLAYEYVGYDKPTYKLYLSILHYIPYEIDQLHKTVSNSFFVCFTPLVRIIEAYYSQLYDIDSDSDSNSNRYKTLFQHLFMKFLYNHGPEQCGIPVSIYVVNHKDETAEVSFDIDLVLNFIKKCFQNGSYIVSIPVSLDVAHANTLIISKIDKRITRVEPNFEYSRLEQEVRDQFDIDKLKTGNYPFYTDYVNQELYKYFISNPIIIDGVVYPFEGHEPDIIDKTCPAHGSMCMAVSSLTYFLNTKEGNMANLLDSLDLMTG